MYIHGSMEVDWSENGCLTEVSTICFILRESHYCRLYLIRLYLIKSTLYSCTTSKVYKYSLANPHKFDEFVSTAFLNWLHNDNCSSRQKNSQPILQNLADEIH